MNKMILRKRFGNRDLTIGDSVIGFLGDPKDLANFPLPAPGVVTNIEQSGRIWVTLTVPGKIIVAMAQQASQDPQMGEPLPPHQIVMLDRWDGVRHRPNHWCWADELPDAVYQDGTPCDADTPSTILMPPR